ncbi:MAG: carotenoid biosynthesis protein [Myxococcaceae bacterium]|nr:MAG: carotenoid biosynthesis protein [Myxococcaceae bacterium]
MSTLILLVLVWTVAAVVFSAVTLVRVLRQPAAPAPGRVPPLLLLRPLDEPTEAELQNLALPLPDDLPVRQVIVSPYRPRLAEGVEWQYSDPPCLNRKVGHVLYALDTLRRGEDQILVVDADVAVDRALLEDLSSALSAGAALSTAAPVPEGGTGLGAAALRGLLRSSQHSFVALDLMSLGSKAICGKALGLSGAALEALRGLAGHIGEDLELARFLHVRGLPVTRVAATARMPLGRVELPGVVRRIRRWMLVLRAHRPGLWPTVPLLLAPTPLLLLLAVWVGSPAVVTGLAVLLALRIALGLALSRGTPEATDGGWEWLLGEATLLAAWMGSLAGRTVDWRGRCFTLVRGGRMERTVPGGES